MAALRSWPLLGVIWRILKEIARVGEKSAWMALYIGALQTLLSVEVGFVIPHSVLTRFVVVTVLLLLASTAPAGRRLAWRSSTPMTPVPFNPARFRKAAATGR